MYIVSGGWPTWVQEGARDLASTRGDVFHLADTGFNLSADQDLEARLDKVPYKLFQGTINSINFWKFIL